MDDGWNEGARTGEGWRAGILVEGVNKPLLIEKLRVKVWVWVKNEE